MKKLFFIFIFMFLISGCAFRVVSTGPSVCDVADTYEKSWLCKVAGQTNLPLEEYGVLVNKGVAASIITDSLTQSEVKGFINNVRLWLDKAEGVSTYGDLINYLVSTTKGKAIAYLVSDYIIFFNSDMPINRIDIDFIRWEIDQIEKLI